MPKEKDPFWKYATLLNESNGKWRCNFCKQEQGGGATRIKAHLAGIGGFGIKGCERVDVDVRAEARGVLMAKKVMDSSDRGLSEERIPGNIRAASTGTINPPNVGGETNLQLPQVMSKQPASLRPKLQNVTEASYMNPTNAVAYLNPSSDMPPLTQSHELMNEMGQGMRAAYIANPPFDVTTGYYGAPPSPNFPLEPWTSSIASFDLGTSNAQQNPGAPLPSLDHQLPDDILNELQRSNLLGPIASDLQLSNMATISTSRHSSQPLQRDSQCGYSTGLVAPITSLPLHGPLTVESDPETPGDIINMIGPRTSEGESISCSVMALAEELWSPSNLLWQSQCSIQSQMPMNYQQIPAGVSSFQYNQLPATGNSHCLPDSNQHSQLQTPMDIDPSIASRHTSDPPIVAATIDDSQVPKAATNTTGASSSQDMNRCSPTTNLRSIYANDEEIRSLKRKVEELDDKEAAIKEQMEIESAASSVRKKPRILVKRWLKETERARNNFQIIGQANAKTLPPKEQVETLTREVEELIKQTLPQTLLIEERDAKGDRFLVRELIGEAIHRNIELIWGHLKKNHACKLGIYGMGGVGKTTIMMRIYNRILKDPTFDGVAFVTVSQDFSIYKLQSDIWKALKPDVMKDEHENKRAAMLSEQLETKKNFVLILDDVWERLDLEEAGIPVRVDGLKLVLTTRSIDVCHQTQCKNMLKINPLSQLEAKSLFLEELGSEVALNSKIEEVMKSIVRECAGLPIGVITMARSMRGVTHEFEWAEFLTKLTESCKGQMDMEKKVIMNLKFSYDRLGNPDVQKCFLSCALYPEDKLIDKSELVEFFIDQGLIGGLNTRKEQYDRGLTILEKLGNVCLLEKHKSGMKMHDVIRDMALHIMSETSIVKAGKRLTRIPLEEDWTNALEKVSLMKNKISEFTLDMSPNCPKLSILLLNDCLRKKVVIPDSFFRNLLGLEVLNLSGNSMMELPNSISDLVNLRVLLLRGCRNLRRIPYLGKLASLRKLDVGGCKLQVLEGLENLVNLRYLDIFQTRIRRLPKGALDRLLNLQCLKVWAINEEEITKLGALETLRCQFKNADDFNKCVRAIEQSSPRYYDLNVKPEKLKFSAGDVNLGKPKFIVEVGGGTQLQNLGRGVDIREWGHAIVSEGGECAGIFILIPQDVETMTMEKCNGITNLSSMGPLEYLERLEIEECENVRVLHGGHNGAPTLTPRHFSNLTFLRIHKCPKVKYLFGSGLSHLEQISIVECEEMVGIIAAITSPPPHPLPFFPSLEEIHVQFCHKMKRAVEFEWLPHFPNLRRIRAWKCEKMEEIIGGPPPYLSVEEISLESLEVASCHNMRKLLPHEWLLRLRNLQSIQVRFCEGMVEIISKAGQGQEGSIMTLVNNTPSSFQPSSISLPKLEKLMLLDLPQLRSICEVPISCDSMKELRVYKCLELKRIPLKLRLCEIEELPHIWVEDEERWKTLMWDHPDAQAILQPYLRKGTLIPPKTIELSTKGKDL